MEATTAEYPARLDIDYPDHELNRVSTLLRIFYIIPIAIVLGLFTSTASDSNGNPVGLSVLGAVGFAVFLLVLFRQKYPRWWFDFLLEAYRFSLRVTAYGALMTDRYPSTDEEQSVHLDITYPDVERDLNRWMPLVKWLLAIPHYIVLFFLFIGVIFSVIVAWFAILFTGRYPPGLFEYVEGVLRWGLRVHAYAFLLVTDEYPPFRLD